MVKTFLGELTWLIFALVIAVGIHLLLGTGNIDFTLYDSYFVVSPTFLSLIIFIATAFIIYLIKENRFHFKRKIQNLITIVFGLLLIAIIVGVVLQISR